MIATEPPPPDGRSAFFAGTLVGLGVGRTAPRFGRREQNVRGGGAHGPTALSGVTDAELRSALRVSGQRDVAIQLGVSRRLLHSEITKRFGPRAGSAIRRESPLDMRDAAIDVRLRTSRVPAVPRAVRAAKPRAATHVLRLHTAPIAREAVVPTSPASRPFSTWSGTDWLNWLASAPIEEQRAWNAYGIQVLNRSEGDPPVPIPTLSDPVHHSHDRGQGNVDIKSRKALPAQPIKAVTVGEKWR